MEPSRAGTQVVPMESADRALLPFGPDTVDWLFRPHLRKNH